MSMSSSAPAANCCAERKTTNNDDDDKKKDSIIINQTKKKSSGNVVVNANAANAVVSPAKTAFIQRFCRAVERGGESNNNARIKKAAALLHMRPRLPAPANLDEPLLAVRSSAMRILEQVAMAASPRKQLSSSNNAATAVVATTSTAADNPQQRQQNQATKVAVLRGLLLMPSAYETPWKAACEMIAYMHVLASEIETASTSDNDDDIHNSRSSDEHCCNEETIMLLMTDVHAFLQQQVAYWWECEEQEREEEQAVLLQQRQEEEEKQRQRKRPRGGGRPVKNNATNNNTPQQVKRQRGPGRQPKNTTSKAKHPVGRPRECSPNNASNTTETMPPRGRPASDDAEAAVPKQSAWEKGLARSFSQNLHLMPKDKEKPKVDKYGKYTRPRGKKPSGVVDWNADIGVWNREKNAANITDRKQNRRTSSGSHSSMNTALSVSLTSPIKVQPIGESESWATQKPRDWILELVRVATQPWQQNNNKTASYDKCHSPGSVVTPEESSLLASMWGESRALTERIALNILSTLVPLIHGLEQAFPPAPESGKSLLASILEMLFTEQWLQNCSLAFWVQLTVCLRPYLREETLRTVQVTVFSVLEGDADATTTMTTPSIKSVVLPTGDLSRLTEQILSLLCASVTACCDSSDTVTTPSRSSDVLRWMDIVFRLLVMAATVDYNVSCREGASSIEAVGSNEGDASAYGLLEDLMTTQFASLSYHALECLWESTKVASERIKSTSSASTVPCSGETKQGSGLRREEDHDLSCVWANVQLILYRTMQKRWLQWPITLSQSPFVAMASPFEQQIDISGSLSREAVCAELMGWLTQQDWNIRYEKAYTATMDDMHELLEDLSYQGSGVFLKDDTPVARFSAVGKAVCRIIFLFQADKPQLADRRQSKARAESCVQLATHMLSPLHSSRTLNECDDDEKRLTWQELAVATVVLVTIYSEVPCCRAAIVQNLRSCFSDVCGSRTPPIEAHVSMHVTILSTVIRNTNSGILLCPEIDKLPDLLRKNISLELFFALAQAVLPLPSARETLLSVGKDSLYHPIRHLDMADATYDRVECGLFALCLVVGEGSGWGKVEMEAWGLLSQVIVENRPPLPMGARPSLYHNLANQLASGHVSAQTQERMLRACLVRLLRFFGTDASGNEQFIPARLLDHQRVYSDDVALLLNLATNFLAFEGNAHTDGLFTRQFRIQLLKLLMQTCSLQGSRESPVLLLPDSLKPGGPSPVQCAAMHLLSMHYQYALGSKFVDEDSRLFSSEKIKILLGQYNDDVAQCRNLFDIRPAVCGASGNTLVSQGSKQIRVALCGQLFEFLTSDVSLFEDFDDKIKVVGSLSWLWTLREELSVGGGRKYAVLPRNERLLESSLFVAFQKFCKLAFPVLKHLISIRGPLGEVDQIFRAVLGLCAEIDQSLETHGVEDGESMEGLLRTLFSAYELLCAENSCGALVDYLEQACLRIEPVATIGCFKHSLLLIGNAEDVDTSVASARILVLQVLQKCLCGIVRMPYSRFTEISTDESTQPDPTTGMLVKIIGVFCRDLHVGCSGESGSINADIYAAYLSCIEVASRALLHRCSCSPCNIKEMQRTCLKSAEFLFSIVCTVMLDGQASFKRTIMLSLHSLPLVIWNSMRRCLLHGLPLDGVFLLDGSRRFATLCFDQCIDILRRCAHPDISFTTPWEDMVGADHLIACRKNIIDDSESFDSDMMTLNIRQNDNRGAFDAGSIERPVNSQGFILQLQSQEAWSWAVCCSLDSYGALWSGSLQEMELQGVDLPNFDAVSQYVSLRKKHLCECLINTTRLFSFESGIDALQSMGGPENQLMPSRLPALVLPTTGKLRLCSLLERIFFVLAHALRTVSSDVVKCITPMSLELPFVEALCCIASWISDGRRGGETNIDLSHAVRVWYTAETSFAVRAQSARSIYMAEPAVLRRLPNLVTLVDEVEEELDKLVSLVEARQTTDCNDFRAMHALLGPPRGDSTRIVSWVAALQSKLKLLQNDRTSLEKSSYGAVLAEHKRKRRKATSPKVQGASDVMDKRSATAQSSTGTGLGATTSSGPTVGDKRRRTTVRNRNNVVADWMRQDCDTDYSQEETREDTFADLEEFIVDG